MDPGRASPPTWPSASIVDATDDPAVAGLAVDLVEPGGRVVTIGLSGAASLVDTRTVTLKDVTVIGLLSGSPGLRPAIEAYASGAVDPRPVVAATVALDDVPAVLAGRFDGPRGPKIQVDRGASLGERA